MCYPFLICHFLIKTLIFLSISPYWLWNAMYPYTNLEVLNCLKQKKKKILLKLCIFLGATDCMLSQLILQLLWCLQRCHCIFSTYRWDYKERWQNNVYGQRKGTEIWSFSLNSQTYSKHLEFQSKCYSSNTNMIWYPIWFCMLILSSNVVGMS